ncbi:MAG: hypothetical protein RLZZ528_1496 [Pseudomonadota bacterium]
MLKTLLLTAALTALAPLAAAAQETDHSGHDMAAMPDSPAAMAFAEANAKMHTDMAIEYTGNADVDFIRGMIPHHQGAIDMARIVLEHGTDPEVRKLAEAIIAAQEGEIAWMQDWLAKNGQ